MGYCCISTLGKLLIVGFNYQHMARKDSKEEREVSREEPAASEDLRRWKGQKQTTDINMCGQQQSHWGHWLLESILPFKCEQ